MVGVVFTHTEVSNFVQQWEYALSHFSPDEIYIVGGPPPESNVLATAVEIAGPGDLPEGRALVLLAPQNGANIQGETPLDSFTHPVDVVYWFGSDSRHIEAELFEGRSPDYKVYVPTDTPDQMYSFVVWTVVAWDRRQKE